MRAIFVVVCLLLSAASASAEMTVKEFFNRLDGANASEKEFLQTILGQVGNGLSWANSRLGYLKQQRLYCPPANVAFTDAQEVAILRRHSESNPRILQAPYGLGLLISFEEEFRCR